MAERKYPDWARLDIPDIGNGDPNKLDPGSLKQDTGWGAEKPLLQHMNWLQDLQSHYTRANNEFKLGADSYEAEAGEIIDMDNSLAAVTGLLPSLPLDGQWVSFGGKDKFSIFGVQVNGNGKDIMVVGTTGVTLDIDNRHFIFTYDATADIWKINLGIQKGTI